MIDDLIYVWSGQMFICSLCSLLVKLTQDLGESWDALVLFEPVLRSWLRGAQVVLVKTPTMTTVEERNLTPNTKGLVLHSTARYYDLLALLFMRGREGAFREKVLDLAQLRSGSRSWT